MECINEAYRKSYLGGGPIPIIKFIKNNTLLKH